MAHDDTVTGLVVNTNANQLISHSKDGSIKMWSFASSTMPAKTPVSTVYDHDSKIRASDTLDWLLATFDADGKVAIRDLRNPQETVGTWQVSGMDARQQICLCEGGTVAVSCAAAVELYGLDGHCIHIVDMPASVMAMGVRGSHLVASMLNSD
jgi:WD40 repeat protein